MRDASLNLGRILGIHLRIHWTFLFLLVYVGMNSIEDINKQIEDHVINAPVYTDYILKIGREILFVLTVFACVVMHEYGHALTARRFGIRTTQIVVLPIGGVAQLESIPRKPAHELWIALAGPAVNVGIALILGPLLYIIYGNFISHDVNDVYGKFFLQLLLVNIALVVFNMVPAFPMDGGRVLRSLLAMRWGFFRATVIAARVGQVIAVIGAGLIFYYNQSPFILLTGAFVVMAAQRELTQAKKEQFFEDNPVPVAKMMYQDFRHISEEASMDEALAMMAEDNYDSDLIVSTDDYEVRGILRISEFSDRTEDAPATPQGRVGDYMFRDFPRYTAEDDFLKLSRTMADLDIMKLPVFAEDMRKWIGCIVFDPARILAEMREKGLA